MAILCAGDKRGLFIPSSDRFRVIDWDYALGQVYFGISPAEVDSLIKTKCDEDYPFCPTG
jgi:hypothetical protein